MSTLPALLSAVTLDEANRVARRLLDPDRAQIVVAGPWSGPGSGEAVILSASEQTAAPAIRHSKDLS